MCAKFYLKFGSDFIVNLKAVELFRCSLNIISSLPIYNLFLLLLGGVDLIDSIDNKEFIIHLFSHFLIL